MSTVRRNVVKQIVDRIPARERKGLEVTSDHMDQVNQEMRILATRCQVGRLGRGDSGESRAAIVLEYVIRQQMGHRFSFEALAAAVGVKPKQFKELHHKVGNYLSNSNIAKTTATTTTATTTTTKTLATNKSSNGTQPMNASKQRHAASSASATKVTTIATKPHSHPPIRATQNNIELLSIRLSGVITDSHGFATRAKALLRNVETHIDNSAILMRKQYQNDFQRYRPVYEAACFYVVASQSERGGEPRPPKKSRKAKHGNENGDDQDNSASLDVKDVIQASNISESVFLDILPNVMILAKEIAQTTNSNHPSTRAENGVKKRTRGDGEFFNKRVRIAQHESSLMSSVSSSTKNSNETHLASKNNMVNSIIDKSNNNDVESLEELHTTENGETNFFQYSPTFEDWKIKVLSAEFRKHKEAVTTAQKDLDNNAGTTTNVSDADAMQHAADAVLRRHGLLD